MKPSRTEKRDEMPPMTAVVRSYTAEYAVLDGPVSTSVVTSAIGTKRCSPLDILVHTSPRVGRPALRSRTKHTYQLHHSGPIPVCDQRSRLWVPNHLFACDAGSPI